MADRDTNALVDPARDLERRLDSHAGRVVLAIVLLSVALRVIYFAELSGGPLMVQHHWDQSDMHHFDRWAREIVAGDWLSAHVEVPVHRWHRIVARDYFALHPDELQRFEQEAGSALTHDESARALWERWCGGGRLFQDPLYPYLVALTYAAAGPDVRWVFAWQMALGVLTNVLIFFVARRFFGSLAATLAGAIATLYAPALFYEMILLRDSLVVFASFALVLVVGRRFVAGLALGLGMLLKVHFALLAVLALGAAAVVAMRRPGEWSRAVLPLVAGLAVGFGPVVARNVALGVPMTITGSIPAIVTSNGPLATGARWDVQNAARILAEGNGEFFASGAAAVRAHPSLSSYLGLQASKVATLLHGYELPNNENFQYYALHAPVLRWMPLTFVFVAPAGLVGLALGLGGWRRAWPLYAVVGVHVVAVLVTLPYSRYRIPFAVALIPFAGLALATVARWLFERDFRRALLAMGAAAAIALWTASPLPASMTPIRATDCGVPVLTWYGPLSDAALRRGDLAEASGQVGEAVRLAPRAAHEMAGGRVARNHDEAELARLFADLHARHARALEAEGRDEAAAAAQARSAALAAAADAWSGD